jgi:hypothetical protein
VSDRAHKHTFSKHQTTIDFCHYTVLELESQSPSHHREVAP